MGAYVLGGALSGLGSGINSAVTQYTKQKQLDVENALAKIKQAADVQRVNNETDRTGAEVANTNAQTALTQHQNLSPVFGENGYNTAVQGKSAAEAQGALPARLQEMVTQGKISLDNATSLAALDNKYKVGQMNLSYGNESKLQGQQQGFQQGQQGRQQTFESGESQKQRNFESGLNTARMQGGLAAKVAGIQQTQSGQVTPLLINGARSFLNMDTPTPQVQSDNTVVSPGSSLTPAQRARAQTDPTYAAFLRSKGQL